MSAALDQTTGPRHGYASRMGVATTFGNHGVEQPNVIGPNSNLPNQSSPPFFDRPPQQSAPANSYNVISMSGTLSVGRVQALLRRFSDAQKEAEQAWAMDAADRPHEQTWAFAWRALSTLTAAYTLPTPDLIPAPDGSVGAEWQAASLLIELRFRGPLRIYCLVEDSTGQIERISRFSRDLGPMYMAFDLLARRYHSNVAAA